MSENQSLEHIRHSLAHLLAAAVMRLWPDTKRTIGPAIENGFYFDFAFSHPISEEDLPNIEKEMRKILPTWKSFEKHELTKAQALKEYPNNPYKHELIEEFSKENTKLTFYKSGTYWDLCKGGHVSDINDIHPDAFKLTHLAGAYWRGNSNNAMLTRIYGVAFSTKKELDDHLKITVEAKLRDHKKLGKELDLFLFSPLVGAGLPLWTPRGTLVRTLIDDFIWELRKKHGYQKVTIPHFARKELYETSGHWTKFANDLFHIHTREGHHFVIKPMNCPHHTQIYANKPRSYRDLPQRYCETTMIYRDEQTGELHGLSRVRSVTQDDAHIFCSEDQTAHEINVAWDIINTFYSTFGFTVQPRFSRHDPNNFNAYLGTPELWKQAEQKMITIFKKRNTTYIDGLGEAAFYGPKIDFLAKDSLGREWQVGTIQFDFNQPERFNLTYEDKDSKKKHVFMIHVAVSGSLERFISILLEHLAGKLPLWLNPTQVVVMNINDRNKEYAQEVLTALTQAGIRAEADFKSHSIAKKVREAQINKVNYMITIGDKEEQTKTLAIRTRDGKVSFGAPLDTFIAKLAKEIHTRAS